MSYNTKNRNTKVESSSTNDEWNSASKSQQNKTSCFDLESYDPHTSQDDSEEDDGHDTVVLENEFGRYQKCLRCGTEAVGNMMTQFECQT